MDDHFEIEKLYRKLFPGDISWEEVAQRLNQYESNEHIADFRYIFVDQYTDYMIKFNYPYGDYFVNGCGSLIIEQYFKLNDDYYTSLANFMTGNKKQSLKCFNRYLDALESIDIINWQWFAAFILPFREAFPEFWDCLKTFLSEKTADKKYIQFADALNSFFNNSGIELTIDTLSDCLVHDPDNLLANELLGISYYYNNRWRNMLACFENAEQLFTLTDDELFFMRGWAYERLKDNDHAISCYTKCLEIYPSRKYALNNLGYAYMKKKNYVKAEEIFKKCIDEKQDLDCAANNYVRVLLALGKIAEAKKFTEKPPVSISKQLLEKVKGFKQRKITEYISDDSINANEDSERPLEKYQPRANPVQFSSEKLLEDELTARLEKGDEVFGMPLHIYKQKGEYGRQYIIKGVGRLDLLAEDNEGNLYVIELKKDSGYCDAYSQIRSYLDWFEKHKKKKGRKIYGIICLNSPDEELIKAVKADSQVRLFEYEVTYREFK